MSSELSPVDGMSSTSTPHEEPAPALQKHYIPKPQTREQYQLLLLVGTFRWSYSLSNE